MDGVCITCRLVLEYEKNDIAAKDSKKEVSFAAFVVKQKVDE